jgi:hypothetical protein
MRTTRVLVLVAGVSLAASPWLSARSARQQAANTPSASAPSRADGPDLPALGTTGSELREIVDRYATDRDVLLRRYDLAPSAERQDRLRAFYDSWAARLPDVPFDTLGVEGRIDYVLLRTRLAYEQQLLARYGSILAGAAPLLPFSRAITSLHDARRRHETMDAAAAGRALAALAVEVEATRKAVEAGLAGAAGTPAAVTSNGDQAPRASGRRTDAVAFGRRLASQATPATLETPSRVVALRAVEVIDDLRRGLDDWYKFYAGYDPVFTWWAADPYKKSADALVAYRKTLREKVIGAREDDDEPIVGFPIGRDALVVDLQSELIPYTPEDLLAIAEREFAWCEAELKRAARDMGLGDDWQAALERVKQLHVEPGKQPDLVRDLAREAEDYLEQRDLVTVPPLAKEVWRMTMLSPERQKTSPFFLGGEVIQIAFPTDAMAHDDKLMSLRGNNIHFARATVHHELIPGHHLQQFMNARYNTHRRAFRTPFWTEGWALYWEMLLWDLGFPQTPENRMGMLFWRTHRAARIIFSLRFHLGTMTPQECIDFLVDRVGHERANATAEVRRSFNGTYPPLYQLAYMMGGLQFRALHEEIVGSGRMTNRAFHDRILTGGPMPVEMVRARLTEQPLARDHAASWKYLGDRPGR